MDAHPAPFQFNAQFVERQFANFSNSLPNKISMRTELAAAGPVPLTARGQRTRFSTQLHQIVHEARRNPEMPRRIAIAMTFIHIRSHTSTQLER